MMNENQDDFEQLMRRREEASRRYMQGDAAPLSSIVARTSPATFFGPQGGYHEGADEVWTSYEQGAALFESSIDEGFEILHMGASGDIGYWVGFQRTVTYLRGKSEPIPFNLRVTEVFRREGDEWKLIHRHADPLAPKAE
jgi:ketosteroid isomerase-like protein